MNDETRRYIDRAVKTLRDELAEGYGARLANLQAKVDAPAAPDLSPVTSRLDAHEGKHTAIDAAIGELSATEGRDNSAGHQALASVENLGNEIANVRNRMGNLTTEARAAVDDALGEVTAKVAEIKKQSETGVEVVSKELDDRLMVLSRDLTSRMGAAERLAASVADTVAGHYRTLSERLDALEE